MASPVLPFLVQSYGKGAIELGYASAAYQFASIFATPFTGAMSDKYGRKKFFVIGFFGSAAGFLTIAMSKSIWGIYAGRFIGGCFGASMPLAHAFISDVAPGSQGGKYRAQLGSVFMAALIFAPGFGGGLAVFGQTTPFFVAAVMAFLGGLICLKEMPSDEWIKSQVEARSEAANPNKKEQSAEEKAAEDGKSAELARSHRPMILLLFVNGMVLAFGFRVFIMMAALYTSLKFKWTPSEFGFSASMVGAIGIFANLLIYPKVQGRLGKHGTGIVGGVVGAIGYALVFMAQDTTAPEKLTPRNGSAFWLGPGLYLIGMGVQVVGNSFINTSTSSLISRYADKTHQGSSQGCASSLQAVAGMAAPVVGGALLDVDFNINPLVTMGSFILAAVNLCVILVLNRRLPEHHMIDGINAKKEGLAETNNTEMEKRNPLAGESSDVDVEVTKEKLAVLAMDPAQEVVLLRARVKELENQVAALKADQPAGGVGGYSGEHDDMDATTEALVMSTGGGLHQRKGNHASTVI